MSSTPNTDMVFQRISTILAKHYYYSSLQVVEEIMQIKELHVEAVDQNPPINQENDFMNTSPKRVCDDTQKDMLKHNFIKCEEKENK